MSQQTAEFDPNLAFKQFFQDPNWRLITGVGLLFGYLSVFLMLVSSFLIPVSFCMWACLIGYCMRLLRAKINDPNAPLPAWNDWLDLLISGLTWITVLFGQLVLIASVATIALLIGGIGPRYALDPFYPIWAATTVLGTSLACMGASFYSTVIMCNFAQKESTQAAFDFYTFGRKVASAPKSFLVCWLLILGLQGLAVAVPTASLIGVAFVPVACFVANCVGSIILAQVWREAN